MHKTPIDKYRLREIAERQLGSEMERLGLGFVACRMVSQAVDRESALRNALKAAGIPFSV